MNNLTLKVNTALSAAGLLSKFINPSQRLVLQELLSGEEGEGIAQTVFQLMKTIENMPKTYEQDGKGDKAIAYLHYFYGGCDWWITEKDMEDQQLQAFGLVSLTGDPSDYELGYTSIEELMNNWVEIDLYWTPKTLGEIKKGK